MPEQPLDRVFFTRPDRQIIKLAGSGNDLQHALELGLGSEGRLEELDGGVGDVVVAADHGHIESLQLVGVLINGNDLGLLQICQCCLSEV